MNDELKNLQRRMERATAPDCPAEALADSELAEWREGWLALGRILEDQEKLSGPIALAHPLRRGEHPPTPAPAKRISILSVLIAASLLIAATLFGLYRAKEFFPELDPTRQSAPDEAQQFSRSFDLRWDDNWDARMSYLSTRLALVQRDGDGWTTEYYRLRGRANALEWELEYNSL
jgi:hypothetical protein